VGIEVGGAGGGGGGGGGGSCHTAAAAVVAQLWEGRHVGILQDEVISIYDGQRKKERRYNRRQRRRMMVYEMETQEVFCR
jgi:hypothetical protein